MTTATPDTKRRALGKGLDSLLPRIPSSSAAAPAPAPVESEGGKPREISVEDIDRNPFQTRMRMDEEQLAELAASITSNGVVQPILVRPQADGRFNSSPASDGGKRRSLPARKLFRRFCARYRTSRRWRSPSSKIFSARI